MRSSDDAIAFEGAITPIVTDKGCEENVKRYLVQHCRKDLPPGTTDTVLGAARVGAGVGAGAHVGASVGSTWPNPPISVQTWMDKAMDPTATALTPCAFQLMPRAATAAAAPRSAMYSRTKTKEETAAATGTPGTSTVAAAAAAAAARKGERNHGVDVDTAVASAAAATLTPVLDRKSSASSVSDSDGGNSSEAEALLQAICGGTAPARGASDVPPAPSAPPAAFLLASFDEERERTENENEEYEEAAKIDYACTKQDAKLSNDHKEGGKKDCGQTHDGAGNVETEKAAGGLPKTAAAPARRERTVSMFTAASKRKGAANELGQW